MARQVIPILLAVSALHATIPLAVAQVSKSLEGGLEIKKQTAPAVVRIETGRDFRTGFFFRPDGWILTNYHIVKDAPIDVKTGKPFVRITYGAGDVNGEIKEQEEPLWASIFRLDRRADLALLLLDAMPTGKTTVPFIPLAIENPKDGDTCFAIGIPLAGMKWDLKEGKVSSQGLYPDDVAIQLDNKLQPSPQRRQQFLKTMAPEGSAKIIFTTCGLNPGDSGGPILNSQGALIAVTTSIPNSSLPGIRLDNFSYHIHLSEVRDFVKTFPTRPELIPPYSMPQNTLLETEQSKKTGALIYKFSNSQEKRYATYIDFDQSSLSFIEKRLSSIQDLTEVELWNQLGIEWAIVKDANRPTLHYFDLDQNGEYEIVFQQAIDDGDEPKRYTRISPKWTLDICERTFLDTIRFSSNESQIIYDKLRKELPPRYTK